MDLKLKIFIKIRDINHRCYWFQRCLVSIMAKTIRSKVTGIGYNPNNNKNSLISLIKKRN